MPSDLSSSHPPDPIRVRDSAGVGLPFSKGLMATSILVTGLETGRAYAIAAAVEQRLRASGISETSADGLAVLAAEMIAEHAGTEAAERYRAWGRVRKAGRPIIIVMSGASGVGKSTLATRLAVRLGITRVVTTDTIREVLRTVISSAVLPELHISTHEMAPDAPRGEEQVSGFYRQARAVCAASTAVARRLATEGRSGIVEGAHVLPGHISRELDGHGNRPIVVELLMVMPCEGSHRANLTRRFKIEPARRGTRHLESLPAIRALQELLQGSARDAGVPEFDVAKPEQLTPVVVDRVVAAARIVPAEGPTMEPLPS